jgi:type II secretory pathway component GspD/PulD (secretin)
LALRISIHRWLFFVLAHVVFLSQWVPTCQAADPSFVGVLALAVEDAGVQRLGLDDETKAKLLELIDRREAEAINLVLQVKDLPPAIRAERLAPFVQESERLGMALLTVEQREVLNQMRIAQAGLQSLADPAVGQTLQLNEQQQQKIRELLAERAQQMTQGGEDGRRMTRARFERELASVLSDEQRAAWEKLAGFGGPVESPSAQPDTEATAETPREEMADETPVEAEAPAAAAEPLAPSDADPEMNQEPAPESESPLPAETPSEETSPTETPSEETPPPVSPEMNEEAATETAPAESDVEAQPESPAEPATPSDQSKAMAATEPVEPNQAAVAPEIQMPEEAETAEAEETPEVAATEMAETPEGAPAAEPGDDRIVQPPPAMSTVPDGKLVFNFENTPWRDVLLWFAEKADLSLQLEIPPPGTFNYRDSYAYTPAEALDLMNSVLITKGYTLVRHGRMLLVINVADEIPPQLIEIVGLSELDERGDFELLRCLFHVIKLEPQAAAAEIEQLVGPPPAGVVSLANSGQILVTETAAKLRMIRDVIEAIENPQAGRGEIAEISLQHVGAEEFLTIARPLLGLEEDQYSNEDIKIAVDPFAARLFATGNREAIQRLNELIPMVDQAPDPEAASPETTIEVPFIATYTIAKADPQSVLSVMQTLLAGLPDVRLAIDPGTEKLVALARPAEHQTIIETLKNLEGQADQVEVIQLRRMDPQMLILTINKLFAIGGGDDATTGPSVDGDPLTRKLWVRGSAEEIAQIKDLVEKLDGADASLAGGGVGDTIRFFPLPEASADRVLENVELFWPTLRANKIRVITPSAISPTLRQQRTASPRTGSEQPPGESSRQPFPWSPPPAAQPPAQKPAAPLREDSAWQAHVPFTTLVSHPAGQESESTGDEPAASAEKTPSPSDRPADEQEKPDPEGPLPDIVIARTQGGLIIASEDREALNDFETLMRSVMEQTASFSSQPTVFWLKYAKADVAAQTLQQILSGESGGGGSLFGDVASSVLGDMGGGIVGSLLGGSGGSSTFLGDTVIVPDVRLNALIVQASASDLYLIEQLLPIIDKEASPEDVQTSGRPQLIPVTYMPADEMAEIVRQVFGERVEGATSGRQRQPSPEDFIRALRGGRGGQGGQAQGEVSKMTLGVDVRSNSLIVSAPEPLVQEVRELVGLLDNESLVMDEDYVVVPIKKSNPETLQKALESIIGESLQSNPVSSQSSSSGGRPSSSGDSPEASAEQIRRRMEFMRSLQERMRGGGGDSPFGGFRGGGPPGGGFRGGGAPGGGGAPIRGGGGPPGRGGSRGR